MKPCGFCSRHGPKSSKNFREIPDDVTLMVNLVVPKLIAFLLYKLEDATRDKPNKVTALKYSLFGNLLSHTCLTVSVTRPMVVDVIMKLIVK